MNELDKNKPIETLLEETAEQLQPNLMFKAELEEKLRKAHKPRASFTLPGFNGLMPALTSLAVFGALVVFMIWLFQSVEPQIGVGSEDGFACPVTPPNGSLPPSESVESELYLGNGELWTSLWPDGKVYMEAHNQEADGSFSMKWGFVRAVTGPLTVEGRRLDADAEPLRAFITDGYGESGLQILALIFPTTGCWEVTARVGESSLTFVTEVLFGETAPQPIENFDIVPTPLVDATETPQTVQPTAYSWRGMTLYLEAALPETPSQLKMFQTQNAAPATAEDARALAQQFNMNGDIYESPGNLPDTNVYLVVEGNRQLFVQSNMLYHYVTDQSAYLNNPSFGRYENAEAEINAFMQTYGLGSDYVIQYSELYNGYYALPRISNGYTLHLGYFSASGFLFRFTRDGLLGVEAGLVGYEELGDVSIISAEEAWQRILNSTDGMGMQEAMQYNDDENIQNWLRPRPLDETVTVFGWLSSTGKSIDGNPPLITLDAVPVTGNLEGIPENLPNTFVQAIGQFHEENGARTFILESWSLYDGTEEGIQGTITREGDVTSITILEGPTLLLPDAPDDLLLPAENMYLVGITRGDTFEWKSIDDRPMGGGGGGGGGGFYEVNLSGVPVPFPTSDSNNAPVFQPPSEESLQGIQGLLMVNKIKYADGSISTEYGFSVRATPEQQVGWFILKGENLSDLEAYHNRPINIWAHVDNPDENGSVVLFVDRYEIPYPDLQFEILSGTQSMVNIDGQNVVTFTAEDGTTYVQLYPIGEPEVDAMLNSTIVTMEVLRIPGETYAGYPALRVFSIGEGNQNVIPEITADEPVIYEDTGTRPTISDASIESVELVYFVPDQRYSVTDPTAAPIYIQPVWRFTGHYSDGSIFEILVQALTQEFLLPQRQDSPPPG